MQAQAPAPTVPSSLIPRDVINAPGGLNLDVWLCLSAIALLIGAHCGFWLWGWWHWACFTCSLVAIHLSGSVIHDACHNGAHSNRIVNATLGHISALIIGFAFPVFTRVHLQHHAHVNDPKNDPDHFVSTAGPLWLIAPRFFYHEIFFFQRRLWRKYELLEWFLSRAFLLGITWASLQYGFFSYIVTYWFLPAGIVGMALGLFFDYLPHRPFVERNRWLNARVYANPLLNLLILGQNYHLVHHLWPSIPWYKYQHAYSLVKPTLEAKGSPLRLGIFESQWDFWTFLYDVLIGIRLPQAWQRAWVKWWTARRSPSTP
ncbi:fatty acid desaturase [Spirulina major CS-329]|jgi:beta-carotene hydroxylase|uniref:beta-carotene hydroxylase n=1 Tax=Spirulina TaxID=1154 RepID=UPI00232D972A|nr:MULTISPECIES: fatty acid desaturase [Spirulina]MDB9495267.1 fatty acid desaturase [Spirulina subsalsa CS-330]MDB9503421.1 fatty acid desaturase [Spirulina major CS-329]